MSGQAVAKERLETATQIGARYSVTKFTVLRWFHDGVIPAALVVGRVIRFCPEDVAGALALETKAASKEKPSRVPTKLPVL